EGTLAELRSRGDLEVHARSVFLQGLLLMPTDQLPVGLRRFAPLIAQYQRYVAERGCSSLEAALGFVKYLDEVDVAVIGVNSGTELQACIEAYERAPRLDLAGFASSETELVDPRLWRMQ